MYHLKYLTIMSLNYSIAMMGNPLKKEEPKKAYAKAQTNGEHSLKELSTLIASKCTVHKPTFRPCSSPPPSACWKV